MVCWNWSDESQRAGPFDSLEVGVHPKFAVDGLLVGLDGVDRDQQVGGDLARQQTGDTEPAATNGLMMPRPGRVRWRC